MSQRLQHLFVRRRVGPLAFLTAAVAVAALLAFLGITTFLATSQQRDITAPRVFSRTYSAIPLGQVIADLESDRIIPARSHIDPAVSRRRVSCRLTFFATDFRALDEIAIAAKVCVAVPVGTDGEIFGPITIRESDSKCRAGAWGYHYRLPIPKDLPQPLGDYTDRTEPGPSS